MNEITYAKALNDGLREEMKRDEDVFLIGEDLGVYGGLFRVTENLQQEFGRKRVIDTPISENGFTGFGLGASITGLRPVIEILYIDFITLAMDQIVNQIAKMRYMSGNQFQVPLVIRTQGGTGRRNGAQHSQSLESWFIHVPGLKVIMPSTPADAKGLLKSSIRSNDPVVFIEHKNLYFKKGPVPEDEYLTPIGKADIKREGTDATVIATSWMVEKALNAAKELEKEGINVEIVDPRTLKPLDTETILKSIKKTNRIIIVHEACKTGGFGAELSRLIMEEAFDFLDAPVKVVAGLDVPIPYASNLEDASIPQEEDIIKAVKNVCSYKF